MSAENEAREQGARVLREEATALLRLAERLDQAFGDAVEQVGGCAGRIVVTGMGKSGAVGRKIAGTLASTGTPALFLHPAEALHGDLGMVIRPDLALALSYSGETDELLAILPALRRRTAGLIAITGFPNSTLGKTADLVLNVQIGREACRHNLAPTTSTTAMMALGDALAIAVMEARRFGPDDYALLHPAGALGRRLLLRAGDLMRTGENIALVPVTATVRDVVVAIPRAHQQSAIVVGENGTLAGLVTGGDIRRALERFGDGCLSRPVTDIMTRTPLVIAPDALAVAALQQFNDFPAEIGAMPVVDAQNRPVGMLMLNDIVRAGIALDAG